MNIQLSKDADKLICLIYKEFLDRRKNGLSKQLAKDFPEPDKLPAEFLDTFSIDDLHDVLSELSDLDLIDLFIYDNFELKDLGIMYMEQRFPNGISQVLEWLGKIKSAIPFV